jgi:hypothetical protein
MPRSKVRFLSDDNYEARVSARTLRMIISEFEYLIAHPSNNTTYLKSFIDSVPENRMYRFRVEANFDSDMNPKNTLTLRALTILREFRYYKTGEYDNSDREISG